jgi:hypothetical protein
MELVATSIDGFLAYWCGLHVVYGEIHSVFQRALNIRTSGGQLISVLSSSDLAGPNTVVTELPPGLNFIALGLRSGMPVRMDRVEADVGHGALCVRIHLAPQWWPRLAGGAEHLDMVRLRHNISALLKTLPREGIKEGLGRFVSYVAEMVAGRWGAVESLRLSRLERQALFGIRDLIRGTLERDEDRLGLGFGKLIGLGTGMTPSGDDLLCGYIGTLSVVSRRVGGPDVEDLLEIFKHQLRAMKERTTFVSGSLLSYASGGRVSSPVLSVVRALLFGKVSTARSAVDNLLRLGASSGADVLLGVLLALFVAPRLRGGG